MGLEPIDAAWSSEIERLARFFPGKEHENIEGTEEEIDEPSIDLRLPIPMRAPSNNLLGG